MLLVPVLGGGVGELNELRGFARIVRTRIPCRAIRGVCVKKVPRYFSTHYICILQALNWVRPCAWVRLPFPRHLVSVAASDGPSSCLKSRQWGPGKRDFYLDALRVWQLDRPQSCPEAVQHSIDPGVCLLLLRRSRGTAWHDPDDSQTFMRSKGQQRRA